MENNESKARYVGELAVVIFLEIIMLLFRLVQPIRWPGKVPAIWQGAGNELIFFAIEFILVIVVVGHCIYKESYEELGLTGFKKNIGALVFNLGVAAVCAGAAFFTSQFSNVVEVDMLQIGIQIAVNFTAVAFMSEVVYRGFIFNIFLRLTNGKGSLACLGATFLFALSYIPSLFINLSQVSGTSLLAALAGPFLFGIYLSTLYYYTRNLWMCVIIHGAALTFTIVEPDLIITALAALYGAGLLIYLVLKILRYYKKSEEELSEEENSEIEVQIHSESQPESQAEDEQLNKPEIQDGREVDGQIQMEEQIQDSESVDSQKADNKLSQINKEKEDSSRAVPLEPALEKKVIEIPNFMMNQPAEADETDNSEKQELEEDKEEIINREAFNQDKKIQGAPSEEDDLGKVAIIPNTQEELGKVVNLQAKKEELARQGRKDVNFDDTIIMPCINDEAHKRQKKSTFNLKDTDKIVEAEPNFIAHLEEYLGEFEGIYKQVVPTEPPIDIMYFIGDQYHALVTNGMRTTPMVMPAELNEYSRAELMMFIDPSMNMSGSDLYSEENEWLIKLLTDLALYPRDTNSYLGWGHIVGNGEYLEAYDESVDYCGALIYPPMDQKDVNFYRYMEKGESTYIYNVMPLYAEELKFIQGHSGDQFINLMSEMGVKQSIKRHRINIIEELSKK